MAHLTRIPMSAVFTGRDGQPRPYNSRNPVVLHRTVMALFGDIEGKRAGAGILARVEPASDRQESMLLVRSEIAPVQTPERAQTIPAPHAPPSGSRVAFRLAVNAVRRKTTVGPDGRRRDVTTPIPRDDAPPEVEGTRMEEWLGGKLAGALSDVEILAHNRAVLTAKAEGRKADPQTVQIDHVDGFAIVEDPEQLDTLLANGVGRAKNYACGLLTVRPVG